MRIKPKRGLQQGQVWPLVAPNRRSSRLLIDTLNATGESRQIHDTRELVRNLNEMERLFRQKGFPEVTEDQIQNLGKQGHYLHALGFDATVSALLRKIRKAFGSYRLTVLPIIPSKTGWTFRLMNPWATSGGRSDTVALALLGMIYDLAASGWLRRVRECKRCGRWFFARKDDNLFHSKGCQQQYFRESEEGRKKRTDFMQRYRAGLKRLDREHVAVTKSKEKPGSKSGR